jgi:hypothetical protein
MLLEEPQHPLSDGVAHVDGGGLICYH